MPNFTPESPIIFSGSSISITTLIEPPLTLSPYQLLSYAYAVYVPFTAQITFGISAYQNGTIIDYRSDNFSSESEIIMHTIPANPYVLTVNVNEVGYEVYVDFILVASGTLTSALPYDAANPGNGVLSMHSFSDGRIQHTFLSSRWMTVDDMAALSLAWDNNIDTGGGCCTNNVSIITQPSATRVEDGNVATFIVEANIPDAGTGNHIYTWYKDGVEIPQSDTSSYSFTATTDDTGALYTVRVSSTCDSELSNSAKLTIGPPAPLDQTVFATNIYSSPRGGVSGITAIVRCVGIGKVNAKIMSHEAGDGVVVFSNDSGTTWVTKSTPVATSMGSIIYDEANDTWYISNGDYNARWMAYYYSTDDGDTWTNLPKKQASYNWAIALSSAGEIISDGRFFNGGGWDSMSINTDPPDGPRIDLLTPLVGGNGFHVIESGGTYWGAANGGNLLEIESTKTTMRSIINANTSIHGWATDGSGLVIMPRWLTISSSTVGIFTKVTPNGNPPYPTESLTYPSQIDVSTASYGNGVWLLAGARSGGTVRNQIYIYMSTSSDTGTFTHTISLQLSTDRGYGPGPYGQFIEIYYYKDNTWIISYNDASNRHQLDTFDFIPVV